MKKLVFLLVVSFIFASCDSLKVKKSLRTGTFKTFYTNGNYRTIENYKDGFLDGEYKKYFENSNLSETVLYKNGEKTGVFKSFYEDGNLKETGYYKEGLRFGEWIYYNKDKSIKFKKDFGKEGYFNPEIYNKEISKTKLTNLGI